ncbi:uncharacterized protein LOC143266851 isoform X1 [Peromyscus maniculatus bairdii]|uniref:uncharacterized protein LOC107402792 isoform X1 n=1 Tax=Peromyscus maniculatus bairdii TaxID=230844 RepID=UPI003FCF899C
MALGHLQCAWEGKSSQKVVSRGRSTEGGWKENRSGGRRINPRPSGLLPFVLMSTVIHIPPPSRSCRGPGCPCVPAVVVIQTVSPPASPLLALRFSNVLLQPCINTAPPVPQAQVLVSSISFQGPANANQAPVIANQINNVSNQGPEVYNPVPEGTTQLSDVSNQGALSAEVDRQKVLDAAEALLILHNSPQAWQDPCSTSGADGE